MKIQQNGAAVQLENKKMTTLIPVRIKWHGGRKKVIPAAPLPDQAAAHDAAMLVGLSRAYHWQRLIDAGVVDSGSDIARREGLHQTTVNALLRLTQQCPPNPRQYWPLWPVKKKPAQGWLLEFGGVQFTTEQLAVGANEHCWGFLRQRAHEPSITRATSP